MDSEIVLIEPSYDYAQQIEDYIAEFPDVRPRVTYIEARIPGTDYLESYSSVRDWLSFCDSMRGKISWYLAIRLSDNRLIGCSCLRHRLEYDDDDYDFASHIGYSIRPSERRKGYGTAQLKLLLLKAKEHGLESVRIVCADTNTASNRTVLACGGVYIDSIYGSESGLTINRYDVTTPYSV